MPHDRGMAIRDRRIHEGKMAERQHPAEGTSKPEATFWVYVVRCADATLYTGVARSVAKRLAEHNGAGTRGARYTAARRPVSLVYEAAFPNRALAQQEEARIKALSRSEKLELIAAGAAPEKI